MSDGTIYERGSMRVTDKQNYFDFSENSRLIGIYGYEDPELKAMGFFRFTCGDVLVDPGAPPEEEPIVIVEEVVITQEVEKIIKEPG